MVRVEDRLEIRNIASYYFKSTISRSNLYHQCSKSDPQSFCNIPLDPYSLENRDNLRRKCLAFSQDKKADTDTVKAEEENISR